MDSALKFTKKMVRGISIFKFGDIHLKGIVGEKIKRKKEGNEN